MSTTTEQFNTPDSAGGLFAIPAHVYLLSWGGFFCMSRPTWNQLCRLEPKLADLWIEAVKVDPTTPRYDDLDEWYGHFKPRLLKLVGWYSECRDPVLISVEAYDVAYDKILSALPNNLVDEHQVTMCE